MRAAGQMEVLADAVRQATSGADQTALALVARAAVEATSATSRSSACSTTPPASW